MCGLIILAGNGSEHLISEAIHRLKHRGPDEQRIYTVQNFAAGFQRLAINGDKLEGQQPFEHQGWLSVVNGEIYNYQTLAKTHRINTSNCDTKIMLPLYLKLKEQIIEELDGFYAAVLVNPTRTKAICLRDPMGKKPLFVGVTKSIIFIASELKAVDSIEWFKALPKGVSTVDLLTAEVTTIQKPSPKVSNMNLVEALTQSIKKRLPPLNLPVGVFLSGGLDSSIIASITSKIRDDVVYFVLGDTNANDSIAAQTVANYLNLKSVIIVPLPSDEELPHLLNQIVCSTESYNPSIISNGLATYLLARAARNLGIKIVLTGEGADELFGGYHQFSEHEPWQKTRERLIQDMSFTELRRLDLACMANGIEPRCPYLDNSVIALSNRMNFSQLYSQDLNKVVLRIAFEGALPKDILYRKKTSFDVGSGIRGIVLRYLMRNDRSEREELLDIWKQNFSFEPAQSYFHSYPVFDAAINVRGKVHR